MIGPGFFLTLNILNTREFIQSLEAYWTENILPSPQ